MVVWKTEVVKKAIENLNLEGVRGILIQDPGGDYDTEEVVVVFNDEDSLWISGFLLQEAVEDPKDTPIDLIEVTDGKDSRGGFNGDDEQQAIAYGRIVAMLRKDMNVGVVPCMKNYY